MSGDARNEPISRLGDGRKEGEASLTILFIQRDVIKKEWMESLGRERRREGSREDGCINLCVLFRFQLVRAPDDDCDPPELRHAGNVPTVRRYRL